MASRNDSTPTNVSRRSFLKAAAALAGARRCAGARAQKAAETARSMAYVGTFSSPLRDVLPTQVDLPPGQRPRHSPLPGGSRDRRADARRRSYEMGTSPSCLALNAAGTRLYSANETDRVGDGKEGTVSAFAIDRADGQLTLLNTVRSGGAGPTYVSVHPSGTFLLVANYFGGSVAVLPILADGRLGAATDVKEDAGKIGPQQGDERAAGQLRLQRPRPDARPHDPGRSVRPLRPARRSGTGPDLRLEVRRAQRGVLDSRTIRPSVSLPPGDGPRHFHFHPNGRWFYSIQEEGSTIVLFDYDAANGRLTARQTISTLPPGLSPAATSAPRSWSRPTAGSSTPATACTTASASSRWAGRRADLRRRRMDARQLSAELHLRPDRPVPLLLQPAGATTSPSSAWIAKTGGLNFTGHYTPVGNPSSIVFLDLAKAG